MSCSVALVPMIVQGLTAIPEGMSPTPIAVPAVLVAVSIGVTVSGEVGDVGGGAVGGDRDPGGWSPTAIGVPAVLVAVLIGVTLSVPGLAT